MTPQALIELQDRCKQARTFGRQIANAAALVSELEALVGAVVLERGVLKNSPAHILALIEKVGSGETVESAPSPAPKAKKPRPRKKSQKKSRSNVVRSTHRKNTTKRPTKTAKPTQQEVNKPKPKSKPKKKRTAKPEKQPEVVNK